MRIGAEDGGERNAEERREAQRNAEGEERGERRSPGGDLLVHGYFLMSWGLRGMKTWPEGFLTTMRLKSGWYSKMRSRFQNWRTLISLGWVLIVLGMLLLEE
jgi:hypothetical protein